MKKMKRYSFALRMNHQQKGYLLHHVRETRFVYFDIARKLEGEKRYSKQEIFELVQQYHRHYVRCMMWQEKEDLIIQLMRFQKSCLKSHGRGKLSYHCVIMDKKLHWRNISLYALLPCYFAFHEHEFCFARLLVHHHRFVLQVYLRTLQN